MGIKSLSTILNSKCKSAINKRTLDAYNGMILGIDISIFLYKYLYVNDDHLEGIFRLLLRLVKNGILPLVVFDGRPPKEKNEVLATRKEKRETLVVKKEAIEKVIKRRNEGEVDHEEMKREVMEQMQNTTNENTRMDDGEIQDLLTKNVDELQDELDKTARKIIYVRHEHIESTKRLLNLMGLPYIVSKGEAETLMGHLCREEIIDGCISEDTDVLVNGGRIFIRNISADKNQVDECCLQGVLDGLEMTHSQFIDMCILCGCDYTTKIGGMGPQTAYKLMKKHGNIEGVLEELRERPDKYQIPEGDNFDYEKARYLFLHSTDNEDRNEIRSRIRMRTPDLNGLITLLRETRLSAKYYEEITKNYLQYIVKIKNLLPLLCEECVVQTKKSNQTTTQKAINSEEVKKSKKITDFFNNSTATSASNSETTNSNSDV